MNFREWLEGIEENTAVNTSQNTKWGPDSMYGGARTMLPVDRRLNNRATASLIGGIGQARAKIAADMGAEPGSAPQLADLEDIRKNPIRAVYMPLQLPADWTPQEGVLYAGKGLQNRAMKTSQRPSEDPSVWGVDKANKTSITGGGGGMKTVLFEYDKAAGPYADSARYQTAVNFTQALMKVDLSTRLAQYSHLINLENPSPKDRQEMPVQADQQGQKMHMVMMCSFVFSPRTKDTRLGGNEWEDIQDRLNGTKASAQNPQQRARPNSRTARPAVANQATMAATRRNAAAAQARRANTATTGPVTT